MGLASVLVAGRSILSRAALRVLGAGSADGYTFPTPMQEPPALIPAPTPRGPRTRALAGLAGLALLALPACQSVSSWQGGCAAAYSGVRYFKEQYVWLPLDGKIFFTLDLPFTALVDTLAIPVTYWFDPTPPIIGFVRGCRWADPR